MSEDNNEIEPKWT